MLLGGLSEMLVDQKRPPFTFSHGDLVSKHVQPTADDLAVDSLGIHQLQTTRDIAQWLGNRSSWLTAGKGEAEATAFLDQTDRGKLCFFGSNGVEQAGRHQVGV